jgi:threonine/homoserine/homoserine lactone efflux protein
MTFAGFFTYAGALAIAAAIPGPGIIALIARALGSGFRSALFMAMGLVAGDLVYLTAVVLGLALLAQTFGVAFLVVKWVGVAYLAWLAWTFWRTGIKMTKIGIDSTRDGALASMLSGLFVTLGNPKVMVFYLAITPTIIDIATVTPSDYGVLIAITAMVLLVVLAPYLALAAKARWFLATPRALKALNRTAASFMAGVAAAIAFRQ